MPRGTIDWKSLDSYHRLLAAMVAAQDMKLNYKKIADMYGEGATYDSIEGRFRIIRKDAAKLKSEIDSGSRPEAPPRGGGSTATPRKRAARIDGTISGRVTKPAAHVKSENKKQPGAVLLKRDTIDLSSSSPLPEDSYLTSSDTGCTDDGSFQTLYNGISFDDAATHFLEGWSDEHIV